jgi:hypothetical protein
MSQVVARIEFEVSARGLTVRAQGKEVTLPHRSQAWTPTYECVDVDASRNQRIRVGGHDLLIKTNGDVLLFCGLVDDMRVEMYEPLLLR